MGGISALLGTLALVGFLLFLGGAGLAVVAASQGRPARGGVLLAVAGLVIGLLFSVVSQGLIIVEPTQVAVIINTLSGGVEEPRRGGTHIIVPVVQRVAVTYPITQQEYSAISGEGARANSDEAIVARTSDGQTVLIDVTVIFQVDAAFAKDIYLDWNENYSGGFIQPTTRSIVREVISKYTAEQIYGEARETMGDDIKETLNTRFAEENFILTDLLVRDISFSEGFTEAIEQKVVAEQNLQRARTDAQRAATEAEGRANAAIAAANGEAQSIEIRAQAEAEALRLVSEQIAANPSLIQYLYVQNLSDNVELVLLPSNSPFLFDLASLADPNSGFIAPDAQPESTPTPGS
ncbi:MAG: prohibitin family protein [Anaerolineae bacterium]|nr:prohibitin family protein [Anaerolineae bacterium]